MMITPGDGQQHLGFLMSLYKCRGFGGDWIWDRFVWGLGF